MKKKGGRVRGRITILYNGGYWTLELRPSGLSVRRKHSKQRHFHKIPLHQLISTVAGRFNL